MLLALHMYYANGKKSYAEMFSPTAVALYGEQCVNILSGIVRFCTNCKYIKIIHNDKISLSVCPHDSCQNLLNVLRRNFVGLRGACTKLSSAHMVQHKLCSL
jgi:hypothetical protein